MSDQCLQARHPNATTFTFIAYDVCMRTRALPSVEELECKFDYDSNTGDLIHRKTGKIAGTRTSAGYIQIYIQGHYYRAHRLVWRLLTGEDPGETTIDHIFGDRSDNRIEHLRLATQSEQNKNKPTTRGYRWDERRHRFIAFISINGRYTHLGCYREEEDAREAHLEARLEHYGEVFTPAV